MITDSLLMYFLFQLLLFVFNIIGFKKMPLLLFFTIIGSMLLAVPTLEAFEDYIWMGLLMVLINTCLPVIGLVSAARGS